MATLSGPAPAAGGAAAWWLAARPRTLPLAAAPVAVGAAWALRDGVFSAGLAAAALLGALGLQVGANFANDAFDHERGADAERGAAQAGRAGPPRAAASGLLSPAALKAGTAVAFLLAACAGLLLVRAGGWPLLAVGGLGMVAAVTYVGPGAYGYRGGGELAVFLFFGLAAVCGTYWAQARDLHAGVLASAVPMASLATAVLVANNVRDRRGDAAAGKRTWAVRLGPRGARLEYAAWLVAAFAGLPVLAWLAGSPWLLLPFVLLPEAVALVQRIRTGEGAALNPVLERTARLALAFAACLAVGLRV